MQNVKPMQTGQNTRANTNKSQERPTDRPTDRQADTQTYNGANKQHMCGSRGGSGIPPDKCALATDRDEHRQTC